MLEYTKRLKICFLVLFLQLYAHYIKKRFIKVILELLMNILILYFTNRLQIKIRVFLNGKYFIFAFEIFLK